MSNVGNNFTKGSTEMDEANNYADEAAKAAADFVGRCLFDQHRGVLDCGDKVVLFGNDAYDSDPRSRKEVELVRSGLEAMGLQAHGFGTGYPDEDGNGSWAVVVENYSRQPMNIPALDALVRQAWTKACEMESAGLL
jgi:hypothetical protein